MGYWTLDDIPWDRFDRSKLDPDDRADRQGGEPRRVQWRRLCASFVPDFPRRSRFPANARGAGARRKSSTGGRWRVGLRSPIRATISTAAFDRFQAGYRVDFDSDISRRGSRSGRDDRALHGRGRNEFILLGAARRRAGAGAEGDLPQHRGRRDPPLQALLQEPGVAASSASRSGSGSACGSPLGRICRSRG